MFMLNICNIYIYIYICNVYRSVYINTLPSTDIKDLFTPRDPTKPKLCQCHRNFRT